MDIYSFINSADIAKHCRELNHKFTPVELAYLIHASEWHTIPEKHDAWKKLIEETPDMELEERPWTPHFDSLHDFLQQYMQIENKYIDQFYRNEPDCVYFYEYLHQEDREYSKSDILYKDFSACYENMISNIDEPDKIIDFRISKQWLNTTAESGIRKITLCITEDNTPVMLWAIQGLMDNEETNIFIAFDGLWLEIPTPFQKGDILVDGSRYTLDTAPFVLDSIPYWIDENNTENLIKHHRTNGDISDMCAQIYSECEGTLYSTCGPVYLHMEYFTGVDKFLTAVSESIKGETTIANLLHSYDTMKREKVKK